MKKFNFFDRFGMVALLACAAFATTFLTVSCSDDDDIISVEPDESVVIGDGNKLTYITDEGKAAMLRSIKDLDGTGRIYEIDYTEDYKLDEAIQANIKSTVGLLGFVQKELYDVMPTNSAAKLSFKPGCSAFAVPETGTSNYLMGRNYDFCHYTKDAEGKRTAYVDIAAFVVRTSPKNGYKSISMVDGLNFDFGRDFHKDTNKDISMLIGLPYGCLDGINEKGFAMGVLSLNEAPTKQNESGKNSISTTVAIRLLLDRCATVKEAIDTLRKYNMQMTNLPGQMNNYHFYMADATGDYAIVEYTYDRSLPDISNPTKMEVFTNADTARYVTNFYVSPTMVGTPDGWGSTHGLWRYDSLKTSLSAKSYSLTSDEAMNLLKKVSQAPSDEITSQTQWSTIFNLSQRSLRVALLRDYAKEFKFKIE